MKNLMKSASCGNPAKFVWQEKPKNHVEIDSTKVEYKIPNEKEVEDLKNKITNPEKQKEVEINRETADGVFEKMSPEQKQDFLEFLEENDKEWEEFSEEEKKQALSLYEDVAQTNSGTRKLPDFMFKVFDKNEMTKYMKPGGILGEDYKHMTDEEYKRMIKSEESRKEKFNKLDKKTQRKVERIIKKTDRRLDKLMKKIIKENEKEVNKREKLKENK